MIGFAQFLGLVHRDGREPRPWQTRLAERCATQGPPDVIAVPTGAGKTTTVDALVWALACQAERPAAERTVGVRIVWAIDRRIVVDEVHRHACELAALLDRALERETDPLHELAARLAGLSGGRPLEAMRWRGGLEERPERHGPLQAQIITSTVAQIGSRLLFRGFGVGERSLAMEAGFAACDTTICLDEAHLAKPFGQTVEAIRELRGTGEQMLSLPGLGLITITATPRGGDSGEVLRLGSGDREALGPYWNGPKRARLLEPPSPRDADCVKALVDATLEHVDADAPTVACVVNTVRRAREVFAELQKKLAARADVGLLIGPQRPADRAGFLDAQRRAALFEGALPPKPLVVVATQTFEVGLDADVAAMVSESASATALVQRLGRLNRRGEREGRATIVRDAEGWLYRDEEPLAWDWLCARASEDETIDISVAALHDDPERPPPIAGASAPMLTPEVAELFAQSAPRPHRWTDPDVEAFLRGADSEPQADVALCWRCDLRLDMPNVAADAYREMLLELAPPQRQELLTLSVTSARALLAARFEPSTAAARAALADTDVEGETAALRASEIRSDAAGTAFMVRRRGRVLRGMLAGGDANAIRPNQIQPGDTIVLPTDAGGADEHGLAPRSHHATDVAADLWVDPDDAGAGDEKESSARERLPAPVRITPWALERCLDGRLRQSRWARMANACRGAEQNSIAASSSTDREKVLDKLLARLLEPGMVPAHDGLERLARRGANVRLALRSVGPVDREGMPVFDEAELREDEEQSGDNPVLAVGERTQAESDGTLDWEIENAEQEQAEGELETVPGAPLLAWVLMAISDERRDWQDREQDAGGGEPPTLEAHELAVHDRVKVYAERAGLPEGVRGSLELAARVHDHGKADPRIQAYFRDGVAPPESAMIAKSVFGERNPRVDRMASGLAGLPHGLRHELESVATLTRALERDAALAAGLDPELALHCTGVHHGLGRPIPRVPYGGAPPREFHVEAAGIAGYAMGDGRDGWAEGAWLERFWRVCERYGLWGVAYLEGLLIAADRAVSAGGG